MEKFRPDFFVANGDMIYADNDCPAEGIEPDWQNVPDTFPGIGDPRVDWENPAELREVFNAHWRYNRADLPFQAFLASIPMYVQWDDHEVINDFGGAWRTSAPQPGRAGYYSVVGASLGAGALAGWRGGRAGHPCPARLALLCQGQGRRRSIHVPKGSDERLISADRRHARKAEKRAEQQKLQRLHL